MKVYEALAEAFVQEGVRGIFGVMGDANMFWMNALHQRGVELYDVRHEGASAAMADGWARVTGETGVCSTTCGPGFAQISTTMMVASRAGTPLVAFCGDTPEGDEDHNQRMDERRFAEAMECGFVRVHNPDQAFHAVQQAFCRAKLEQRPVVLSAPMDVQDAPFEEAEQYIPSAAVLPPAGPYPNPIAVNQALAMVQASERPVIIVGRGAKLAGAGDAVLALADRIGALVATTLVVKNWLSEAECYAGISGLYASKSSMELLQEADCVIAVGASMNTYTTEHGYLYPSARFVHIDSRPHLMMGGGTPADCYVSADARLGVERLVDELDRRAYTSVGYRAPEVRGRLANTEVDPEIFEMDPGTHDPREVCRVLDEAVDERFGLILGSGHQAAFGTMHMKRSRPFVVSQHHFGCIGQGLNTGIGAVLALNQPAVLVDGDASVMMHLVEFETAARYNVPLMVVVLNDEGLGAEYHKSAQKGLDTKLATVPTPDLGAVGIALGGRGARVHSLEDLRTVAKEFTENPQPTLVDVRISRTVLSVPYRRLWHGQDV